MNKDIFKRIDEIAVRVDNAKLAKQSAGVVYADWETRAVIDFENHAIDDIEFLLELLWDKEKLDL